MTSTTPQERSHLLSLPTELRISIYRYTVISNAGLVCILEDSVPRLYEFFTQESHSDHEINCLKYVCRTFYNETRGISLQMNDLVFLGMESFARFIRVSTPKWHDRLHRVVVFGTREESRLVNGNFPEAIGSMLGSAAFTVLHDFCTQHPSARLVVRLDQDLRVHNDPKTVGRQFFMYYGILRQALRHDLDQFSCMSKMQSMIAPRAEAWRRGSLSMVVDRPLPDNLRITPTASFDEKDHLQDGFHDPARISELRRLFEEGC